MMKTLSILFVLTMNLLHSQNKEFVYEYTYIPDSTNVKNQIKELVILNVNSLKSEFYGHRAFTSDSTMNADMRKGTISMPLDGDYFHERVIKNYKTKELKYITILADTKCFVDQKMELKWNLLPKFDTILDLKTQMATVDFGGRKWIAWFSKEIPIQDGPYKFFGLPGLILKIYDIDKSHLFEIKAIKSVKNTFEYPNVNNYEKVQFNNTSFKKFFKMSRKAPIGTADRFVDYTDEKGVFHSGMETYRRFEKEAFKNQARNNNIIEIELLK